MKVLLRSPDTTVTFAVFSGVLSLAVGLVIWWKFRGWLGEPGPAGEYTVTVGALTQLRFDLFFCSTRHRHSVGGCRGMEIDDRHERGRHEYRATGEGNA